MTSAYNANNTSCAQLAVEDLAAGYTYAASAVDSLTLLLQQAFCITVHGSLLHRRKCARHFLTKQPIPSDDTKVWNLQKAIAQHTSTALVPCTSGVFLIS
jgi:hypothetical protein